MDTDEDQRVVPFQLQFDKPIPFQIKIAEWNPEKDLLAMATEDSKIILHRFNWQRLWTISPGKCITSLCWRPDGKAIAAGLEDGTISLHDVENGKLLRSSKSHTSAVVSLNWEEDSTQNEDDCSSFSAYEDRTSRFFPPAPRAPRVPGIALGEDNDERSHWEILDSTHQRFNILCSGDKDGSICFSLFGIFPIGKVNIHQFSLCNPRVDDNASYQLLNGSINKVTLAKDLCHLIVMCSGELSRDGIESSKRLPVNNFGLCCLVIDTSIFKKRKNELHQVAQQASSIEDLTEVIRASLSVMFKQWSDAMQTFHNKFDSLPKLISDHGLDSTPQEEFLSLLGGARTSPPVHQFLVNTLGDPGLKRVSKSLCGAGKELQLIVLEHLHPATEIIGFRMGELRGFSKWRARFQAIGLDEQLISNATEKAGLLLIQVERFLGVLTSVTQEFSNFFSWLRKCIKILMSEATDQLPTFSSELVIIFLKFLYDQDPVKQLIDSSGADYNIEVDSETVERLKELVVFGGFSDTNFLQRTLAKEFMQMESCFKEAFEMPFSMISKKLQFKEFLPLFPISSSPDSLHSSFPVSISHYQESSEAISSYPSCQQRATDYISFRIPDDSMSNISNCIGIIRGFTQNDCQENNSSLEAILLSFPDYYDCVDICLYKDSQVVLLLNEMNDNSECSGNGFMVIMQMTELPFQPLLRSTITQFWTVSELKDTTMYLELDNEKVRSIPHSVIAPLAVSASRGVACVFGIRKRALVFILEEDEEEISDEE
ncbi:anaphase-promoting complex subunit 4 [Impatiens glandulifera]|uniref:anaphase-promoting complex subunit 4 n=1 Tax=Impatiens glandulifera TaxID=253017 RepID=UPI001FB137F7|nr:anaphase-promoting complex subunit 4 [Impatiens glandulifera]